MRIAILTWSAGYIWRGTEVVAYELHEHLNGIVMVFGIGNAPWVQKIKSLKIPSDLLRVYYSIAKIITLLERFNPYIITELSYYLFLLRHLNAFQPDVIIGQGSLAGRFCKIYRFFYNTPFILPSMGGICLKDLKCKPDGYIALTPEVKKFVGLQFPEIYVEGIPNGVDLDLFTPKGQFFSDDDLKEMADIKDPILEHPYVLSTSAFVSFKRLDLLIDAMSKLGEGSLIFTNDGPLKDYIINYGRKKLGKRFIYVGTLDFKKLSILYRTCDLFSLPSDKREGFGNVYIEAMASNLPIVATNDEKRRWIIGEKAGILIDVRNIDVYAEAIKNAYEKDWEKYPRTQAERYSWKSVGERYMELLQRIVNHKE